LDWALLIIIICLNYSFVYLFFVIIMIQKEGDYYVWQPEKNH